MARWYHPAGPSSHKVVLRPIWSGTMRRPTARTPSWSPDELAVEEGAVDDGERVAIDACPRATRGSSWHLLRCRPRTSNERSSRLTPSAAGWLLGRRGVAGQPHHGTMPSRTTTVAGVHAFRRFVGTIRIRNRPTLAARGPFVNAAAEQPGTPDNPGKPSSRRGPGPSRARGDAVASSGYGRAPQEIRRKRPSEHRYAGWGDGVERASCARAARALPTSFPAASIAGATTIPATVVARRPDALLLCTYGHCGPHVWPDGEIVPDAASVPMPQKDSAE